MTKRTLILTLLFITTFVSFETFAQNIDTVNIYKSKARTRESVYYKHWFWCDKNYSFGAQNIRHQDSLVLFPTKTYYYKYYSRPNGRLILEGKNSYLGSYLDGEVKVYYRNGKIKRTENWGIRERDTCGVTLSVHDAPAPKGTWKYYDKKGHLTQTDFYHIDILACKPLSYKLVMTSNYYGATSLVTKTTNNILESYTFDK
jgi:hypothetical protein